MKRVGILQPTYLPWLGYFEQMAYADEFVFLDDVQYTKNDWRNRNRVKTATGPVWLTVPVRRAPLSSALNAIEINYRADWRRKHLQTIRQNYQACEFFEPLFSQIDEVLHRSHRLLVELDCDLTHLLCRHLDIHTNTSFSSAVPGARASGEAGSKLQRRNRRILEICKFHGAEHFYEGASGASFLDVEQFAGERIEVTFQDYQHPVYSQRFGEFESHQSAIDLIMNTGPEAPEILRSSPVAAQLAGRSA